MREYDYKAPRARGGSHKTWNGAFFTTLPAHLKQYGEKRCKQLVTDFGDLFCATVFEHRDGVKLPKELGIVTAACCPKKKNINPNWKVSAEYDKILNHQNWEANQKTAKLCYTNYHGESTQTSFANGELWGLRLSQEHRTTFSKIFREKWMDYIQLMPWMKLGAMYRKGVYKMEKREEEKDYNPWSE